MSWTPYASGLDGFYEAETAGERRGKYELSKSRWFARF